MPTYAYRCTSCAHEFDAFQKFSDAPLTECPECGAEIRRVFQPVGIVFKGSGWYINDSRKGTDSSSDDQPAAKASSADKPAESAGKTPEKASSAAEPAATTPAKTAAD